MMAACMRGGNILTYPFGRAGPFLISLRTYAGAGFLAIMGNALRIKGFEASLQFGGRSPFAFAALRTRGRVTVGIYFRGLVFSPRAAMVRSATRP